MADDRLSRELGDISVELERVGDLADGVAHALTSAFRGAIADGRSLRGVLGEVSQAFADIAIKAALKPVGTLVSGTVESLFNGLNPALSGGAIAAPSYLQAGVVPASAAAPQMQAASPMSVTFNVSTPDARSFAASEAEVSAMLLRAVRRGTRAS